MIPLQNAIQEKHTQMAEMPFIQKILSDELTNDEYVAYLAQQYAVFALIERFDLPHIDLNRANKVQLDIDELTDDITQHPIMFATANYCRYLSNLTQEELLPHIYINYLDVMLDEQDMKSKVPGSGKMYEFDNMTEALESIRAIQQDVWAIEANKALNYNIAILDELHRIFG